VAVAAIWLHVWQFRDFTVDDAAISYAYARNLAHGHGLVNIAGGPRVEGYTNFLWVMFLSLGYLFWDNALQLPKIFSALAAGALVVGSAELAAALRGRRSPLDALPALFVAAIMPISYWAMSGLEGGLYMALIVWTTARLAAERDRPDARPWSALLAAGCALTRPDGMLVLAAACFVRLFRDRRIKRALVWYALALGPILAHLAFRYAYYAYPLPNTFYAKVHDNPWKPHDLIDFDSIGWIYVRQLFDGHHLAPLRWMAPLTLLGLRRWYARFTLLALGAAVVFFPLYAPPDWMSEWRFATPLLPLFIAAFSDGVEQAAALVAWLAARLAPRITGRKTLVAGVLAVLAQAAFAKWDLFPSEIQSTLWRRGKYPVPAEGVLEHARWWSRVASQLEIAHPSAAEGDLGGTSLSGALQIVDLGALCDVTLAQQIDNPTAIREYVLDEQRPTFFRLNGHWARYRFSDRTEFQDGWAPYQAPDFGNGHWIAVSTFTRRGVDPRHPLMRFSKEGIELLGANESGDDEQLWMMTRKQQATQLSLQGSAGSVSVQVNHYPVRWWRPGEVVYLRLHRPGAGLKLCDADGCFALAPGKVGALPMTLPDGPCQQLLDRGELSAAGAACTAPSLREKIAERLYRRGVAAEEAGDLDRGYRDFRRALELDPTRAFARRHLEALRMRRREAYNPRWRLRLSEVERAFNLAPDGAHMRRLASAALAAGDPDAAVRAQLATSAVPDDDDAKLDLAECDLAMGLPQLGLDLLPSTPSSDEAAARTMRLAYAAGAPDRARTARDKLSQRSTEIAPGLTLTAAWARPARAGDVLLSLALKRTGNDAPDRVSVAGSAVPFDRPPRSWGDGEIFVHTVRIDLPTGRTRVAVGSATLELDAQPFSGDFESGRLDGWVASGDAFQRQPRDGRNANAMGSFGSEGWHWVDTTARFDAFLGELRSPPLNAGLDDVCFTLAGGNDPKDEGMALEVDGRRVAFETADNNESFREHCFELESLAGHEVRLKLVDARSGAWGHIELDDVECSSHGRPAACAGEVSVK
jgi:hypothetical protein